MNCHVKKALAMYIAIHLPTKSTLDNEHKKRISIQRHSSSNGSFHIELFAIQIHFVLYQQCSIKAFIENYQKT